MVSPAHVHTLKIQLSGVDRNQLRHKSNRLARALILLVIGAVAAELDRSQPPATAVVAPGGLAITPPRIAFGPQALDTTSPPQLITFQNSSTAPIEIGSLTLSNPAAFSWDLRDCPDGRVSPGGNCAMLVVFHPSRTGAVTGAIERPFNRQRVELEGSGVSAPVPQAPARNLASSLTPERLLYGALEVHQERSRTVSLKNSGNVELHSVRFSLEGEHLSDFNLSRPNCGTLAPGAECKTAVIFAPHEEGVHSATLLADAAEGELNRAMLSGVGNRKPEPIAQISPNPLELAEKNRDGSVTITNTGRAELKIENIELDDSRNFEINVRECLVSSPLQRGQSCSIAVKFKGKKSAQGLITIGHNDPVASSKVMLAADVKSSNKKKWATALFAAGAITAAVLTAASSDEKPKDEPAPTKPTGTHDGIRQPVSIDTHDGISRPTSINNVPPSQPR